MIIRFEQFVNEKLSVDVLDDIDNMTKEEKIKRLERLKSDQELTLGILNTIEDNPEKEKEVKILSKRLDDISAEINFIKIQLELNEGEAYTTDGNSGGMGPIGSPQPSSKPGSVNEDGAAMATAGNTGGMGAVVAPTVGSTPGAVWGAGSGAKGSGDVACTLGTYTKEPAGKKKKKKSAGHDVFKSKSRIKKFSDMKNGF